MTRARAPSPRVTGPRLTPGVHHSTFLIERDYPSVPARVFAAFRDPELKRSWFVCDDSWSIDEHLLDFRPGGRERLRVGPAGGPAHVFEARYHEIVPDELIVYAYDMYVGELKLSVSLASIELLQRGQGTRLRFTEQGAFFRGEADSSEREEGTRVGLESLGRALSAPAPGPARGSA